MQIPDQIKIIDTSWSSKDEELNDCLSWEIRKKGVEYQGKVFTIGNVNMLRPTDKKEFTFLQLSPRDWANTFGLTKDKRLVVIEQFRYGSEEVTLETPGGIVEADESLEEGAKREFLEETGFQVEQIHYLNKINPNPAFNTNHIYYYLATGCEYVGGQDLDPGEVIRVATIKVDDFESLILSGKITHSLVVAGFLFFKQKCIELGLL